MKIECAKSYLKLSLLRQVLFVAASGCKEKEFGIFLDNNGVIIRVTNHIFVEFAVFLDLGANMA